MRERPGRLAQCPPQEDDSEEDEYRPNDQDDWPGTQGGCCGPVDGPADRPANRVEQAPDRRAEPSQPRADSLPKSIHVAILRGRCKLVDVARRRTRTGRPGAATLDCVDDLKARAASADQERRARLNMRLRQAFIEGAEEDSRLGRGLTVEEMARVSWQYPGEVPERRER